MGGRNVLYIVGGENGRYEGGIFIRRGEGKIGMYCCMLCGGRGR